MPAQRWRLTYARGADTPDLQQREQQAAWAAAIEAAGLRGDAAKGPKLVPAAPIASGLTADAELADLFLPLRWRSVDVRERLGEAMPAGLKLIGLHDVWLGEPSLPGMVTAGDYRVDLAPDEAGAIASDDVLEVGVRAVLASPSIERVRARADRPAVGDLRPLILDVRVLGDGRLWMRLRIDPTLGIGRPEEVVAAIGTSVGRLLATGARHRERLWLRGEEAG